MCVKVPKIRILTTVLRRKKIVCMLYESLCIAIIILLRYLFSIKDILTFKMIKTFHCYCYTEQLPHIFNDNFVNVICNTHQSL